jgi:hypothetical protein
VVFLSGQEAEFTLGSIIGLGGAVAQPTGQSTTASVGSLTVEEGLGLTGQSFSASVGTVNIFAYGDIDTGQNNSYSDVPTGSNGTYSDVATGKNSTSGSQNVVFKYVSGSGNSVTLAPGAVKMVYATANDGTNPDIDDTGFITASSTDTLTNKTLTAPKIADAGFIADANGAEQIIFQTTASAVNELEVTNAATGNPPILGASGETNVDVHIKPKGSGETRIGTGAAAATLTTDGAHDLVLDTNSGTNSGTITITDGAGGNITITPNGSGNIVLDGLTFPNADGSADQALLTNGSGTLSFGSAGISTGKAIAMAIVFG